MNQAKLLWAFLLLCCFSLPGMVVWQRVDFWAYHKPHLPLLAAALLGYLLGPFLLKRFSRVGSLVRLDFVALSLMAYFATIIFALLFFRLYYSRTYLISSIVLTFFYTILYHRYALPHFKDFSIGIVPLGAGSELLKLHVKNWFPVEPTPHCLTAKVIAFDYALIKDPQWAPFISQCFRNDVTVLNAVDLLEYKTGKIALTHFSEIFLEHIHSARLYFALKRIMDVLLILVALPLIIPLMLLIAILTKVSSPGPVFFAQYRVGMKDTFFKLYKFRTMRQVPELKVPLFAGNNDPRITPIGKVLRRYRLDELPQLWSVLKGDMTLVGPRPEQLLFVDKFKHSIPFYSYRHLVKPGLTGWAQINFGYAGNQDESTEKLRYDLFYVKNMSLSMDMFILYNSLKFIYRGVGLGDLKSKLQAFS